MQYKHTNEELKRSQELPLQDKIIMTKLRIKEYYEQLDGEVYVSFSGGKDSTVLLHIAREIYPDIPAVYADTGLEFPEIKQFVKQFDNVTIIRPEKSFRQVIEEYGWVFPSKDVAKIIRYARQGSHWALNALNGKFSNGNESIFYKDRYIKWMGLLDADIKIDDRCCLIMKEKPLKNFEKSNKVHPINTHLC